MSGTGAVVSGSHRQGRNVEGGGVSRRGPGLGWGDQARWHTQFVLFYKCKSSATRFVNPQTLFHRQRRQWRCLRPWPACACEFHWL